MQTRPLESAFPLLPYESWLDAKNTLHRYFQVVGKIRLSLFPKQNHWWHVPFYISTRGLTTRPIPYGNGSFEIEFDFVDHAVNIYTSEGLKRNFPLQDGLSVSEFYRTLFGRLSALGIEPKIRPVPYAIGGEPFDSDRGHRSYDKEAAGRFFRILTQLNPILETFRGRFTGKSTPVHFFWHSFDLAYTRFSGKPAPAREGAGIVEREAYSHEVISFGFWTGDENVPEPAFYSYTAPEPAGLAGEPIQPAGARWITIRGGAEAIFPYTAARNSENPRSAILDFYESAYQAGARKAGWDMEALKHRFA